MALRRAKSLSKGKKIAVIAGSVAGGIVLALILTVAIYLLCVVCGYYRLEDNMPLEHMHLHF